jgi:anaerobic C4-dicarboxylate transporter
MSPINPNPGVDPARVISPKTVAAAVASFIIPTVLIIIDYLLGEGRGVFASLPVIAQIAVFSLITSAGTAIAAYSKRDPLRNG